MVGMTIGEVEDILDGPFKATATECHSVSLRIVRSGFFPQSRVARGSCKGVPGQHSWVVVGDDCYAKDAQIVDATLWSYISKIEMVWNGTARDGLHGPHGGLGDIWSWGRPDYPTDTPIRLTPQFKMSTVAKAFLDMLGPLDRQGWAIMTKAPASGWPAGEIYAAMDDTKELSALVPIDKLGMLTDRNPGGLYL